MNNKITAPPEIRALLLLAGALWYLSLGYTEMAGSDLFLHLAAGREILQAGSPWLVDRWSFPNSGGDWTNHEWLAAIIYYGWSQFFSLASLVYWKWLIVISTFCLLQWALWRRYGGNGFGALLATGLAATMSAPFLDLRPHLYTLLGFSVLLALCLPRRAPSRWLLTGLFLAWVNLHGGVFFGLMALAILLFPWHNLNSSNVRSALLTLALCALAATINPSGLANFLVPLEYAFDTSSPYRGLAEWRSPFDPGGIRSPLFFTMMWTPAAALIYLVPAVRRQTGIPWEGMALTGLTLAMALSSRRFIPLFGISLAIMLTPLLATLFDTIKQRSLQLVFSILLLVPGALRLLPYPLQAAPAFHYLTAEYSYPADLLDFVKINKLKGNTYALYNWGGYLHWRTGGALKVYIDGRANTVYDNETYLRYIEIYRSTPGWLEAVEATGADYFLWPNRRGGGAQKAQVMLDSGRWRLLYQDSVGWLAARRYLPLPDTLREPESGPLHHLTLATTAAGTGRLDESLRYAKKTREDIPWQQKACQLSVDLLRHQGNDDAARVTRAECLGYFPTRYLR